MLPYDNLIYEDVNSVLYIRILWEWRSVIGGSGEFRPKIINGKLLGDETTNRDGREVSAVGDLGVGV